MAAKRQTAVVLGSNRIPFGRQNGPYARASNQDMLTAALDGLIDRTGIAGERLGEIAGGAVLKHSRDFNLTRESLLGTRIAPETPARISIGVITDGSTTPLPIVFATWTPNTRKAAKLKNAAHATAARGESTRVLTMVAIELAASWKPLMKSKTSATRMMNAISGGKGMRR